MPVGKTLQETLNEELKDPLLAVEFIREAMESPAEDGEELGYLLRAIGQVAKAQGVDSIAKKADISRSTVYQCIREDSNPTIKNVMAILSAIGIKLTFKAGEEPADYEPADVLDVAAYIFDRAPRGSTTLWLQKIVYFSQVESIGSYGVPLFEEPIEAWAAGPVVRKLYNEHSGAKSLAALSKSKFGSASNLKPDHKLPINQALEKYGSVSGEVLSELTHSQAPWLSARGSLKPGDRGSKVISCQSIRDYIKVQADYAAIEDEYGD